VPEASMLTTRTPKPLESSWLSILFVSMMHVQTDIKFIYLYPAAGIWLHVFMHINPHTKGKPQ
jgi:hypothetical protein